MHNGATLPILIETWYICWGHQRYKLFNCLCPYLKGIGFCQWRNLGLFHRKLLQPIQHYFAQPCWRVTLRIITFMPPVITNQSWELNFFKGPLNWADLIQIFLNILTNTTVFQRDVFQLTNNTVIFQRTFMYLNMSRYDIAINAHILMPAYKKHASLFSA